MSAVVQGNGELSGLRQVVLNDAIPSVIELSRSARWHLPLVQARLSRNAGCWNVCTTVPI